MIVASFWVLRPKEHPDAAPYHLMLPILQRSCDRLGLKHVVLTDPATLASDRWPAGIEGWAIDLPAPLMRAVTEVQARFLEAMPEHDVCFVGSDCIMLKDPRPFLSSDADLTLTYRGPASRMPINTGLMHARRRALDRIAPLYRRVAAVCGSRWCDDQISLCYALAPLPATHGIHKRRDVSICFAPMEPLNTVPSSADEDCAGAAMLHFKSKSRKQMLFDWAERHGFA